MLSENSSISKFQYLKSYVLISLVGCYTKRGGCGAAQILYFNICAVFYVRANEVRQVDVKLTIFNFNRFNYKNKSGFQSSNVAYELVQDNLKQTCVSLQFN